MNLSKEEQQRYSRHLLMAEFGKEAQLRLKAAKVLVVGAGGLGCPSLLYLAAAGVGVLGIADDDLVSMSNLQRQVLYNTADIGLKKAGCAKRHLEGKNPLVRYQTHERITVDNVVSILEGYDLVVDGSDNFATRYLLNDACVLQQKPYIYGALFKFEGQVSTFNFEDGPTYRCLYPIPPAAADVPACSEAGVLGVLPGIVGAWQASEAIKIITGLGEPLSGKLLTINLLTNESEIIRFRAKPENRQNLVLASHESVCDPSADSVDYKTLEEWLKTKSIQLIDVREEYEYERFNIGGINIPFSEFEESLSLLQSDKTAVLVCQTGSRSLEALQVVKKYLPELAVYNLKGGIQSGF